MVNLKRGKERRDKIQIYKKPKRRGGSSWNEEKKDDEDNLKKKPKGRGSEGGGSSRIHSLVVTFKVAVSLDQADHYQEDDDNDGHDAGGGWC